MPRIKKLPSHLAEKIAAGEVVERPASIVKELIENSLDAEATQIEVSIVDGGLTSIEVVDNGLGIDSAELGLAVQNHATAKISAESDLEAIASYGFRGEALASIGAVAELTLTSCRRGSEAHSIAVKYGQAEAMVPAALPPGTRARVDHLFAQTPARRKFLRTPPTEYAHIEKMFIRLALAAPQVAFGLKRNGKRVYRLPACSSAAATSAEMAARLTELLGADFITHSTRLSSYPNDAYNLQGYIKLPAYCREQGEHRLVFINRRFVQDRVATHAARHGYKEMLHGNKQPEYALFLQLPPTELDVNVHPAKTEVRFSKSQLVHRLVSSSIRKALRSPPENAQFNRSLGAGLGVKRSSYSGRVTNASVDQIAEVLDPTRSKRDRVEFAVNRVAAEIPQSAPSLYPLGSAIALMHGVYVLAINAEGLVIVDAHAAHERIVFEQLKAQYANHQLDVQPLLLPPRFDLAPADVLFIEERQADLKQLGFELRVVGQRQVAAHAIPALIKPARMRDLLSTLCAQLREYDRDGSALKDLTEAQIEKVLAAVACYGAIRANHKLSLPEMDALLRELERTPGGHSCNHGRPTHMILPKKQLDKMLLRGH